jgi:hypothetical protein
MTESAKKRLVVVNYLSLVTFVCVFCIAEYGSWNVLYVTGSVLTFLLLVLTFFWLHVRTGLWKLTHSKTEDLDEREIQVTHESYRNSYAILTVLTLCLVFFMVLTVRFSFFTLTHRGHYSFGLIAVMSLNYLFNTLPASLIAWREKQVPA